MTSITYNTDIPDAPNNPANDQPKMKVNTNAINSIWARDHFGFNTSNSGYHKQVRMLNQSAPGLAGLSGALYCNSIASNSWPIWQNALGSTIMMSSATVNTANGYCSLPGGMLLQWGRVSSPGGSGSVVFPKAFLAATVPFNIQFTLQRASTSTSISAYINNGTPPTNTGFSYVITSTGNSFLYWMAIGREV